MHLLEADQNTQQALGLVDEPLLSDSLERITEQLRATSEIQENLCGMATLDSAILKAETESRKRFDIIAWRIRAALYLALLPAAAVLYNFFQRNCSCITLLKTKLLDGFTSLDEHS
ncbi:unnamed protein product [Allacma fusca]|nr:unnamed protein product [Allacma fusca]